MAQDINLGTGSPTLIVAELEIINSRTVRDKNGRDHDVLDAVATLPWVQQTCPQMPHEYVHKLNKKTDAEAYPVVERMLKASNRETYLAYFRGYRTPNRYWEAPDGRRYWLTKFMINRCWPDSVEPPRRVDDGAVAHPDWDGPPWAPNGSATGGTYEHDAGGWWPTEAAVAGGYQPCRACARQASPGRRAAWERARARAQIPGDQAS